RQFVDRDGSPVEVEFVAQSVLEPWCDRQGRVLEPQSVALVNSSGAIGCHFDRHATERVADECDRVLKPGGLALLDTGRDGTTVEQLLAIFTPRGYTVLGHAKSCMLDRFTQVCLRKERL